ncbi:DNA-binding protein [Paenibacillus sp. PK3_47]|uniref:DNA-binding protein n=1 Tax=Paenibacillus sp. PK3_47 TaxID=2072642 RepID=UPI00201E3F2A|nr:DNA-binding protein [Paenibacillus sp. PK3_47]UQZ35446.1 DNA-binding protein [Paenibacillus sp. PK3_47]
MEQPTIQLILNKFEQVLNCQLKREEVADWASQFVFNDDFEFRDERLWDLLTIASGIDLKDSPDEYLHEEEDIRNWIKKFQHN